MRIAVSAALSVAASLALGGCDLGHLDAPSGETPIAGPSSGCSGACHGEGDLMAPPRDTARRTDLASIGVGAHTAHLQASGWHKRFACETCHVVPEQVGDPGHIFVQTANGPVKDPLPAEVVFTGLGTGASWDHDIATCTSSYCHGDTLHQTDPATSARSRAPAARSPSRCGRRSTARRASAGPATARRRPRRIPRTRTAACAIRR